MKRALLMGLPMALLAYVIGEAIHLSETGHKVETLHAFDWTHVPGWVAVGCLLVLAALYVHFSDQDEERERARKEAFNLRTYPALLSKEEAEVVQAMCKEARL
jgi:hypothetical protein